MFESLRRMLTEALMPLTGTVHGPSIAACALSVALLIIMTNLPQFITLSTRRATSPWGKQYSVPKLTFCGTKRMTNSNFLLFVSGAALLVMTILVLFGAHRLTDDSHTQAKRLTVLAGFVTLVTVGSAFYLIYTSISVTGHGSTKTVSLLWYRLLRGLFNVVAGLIAAGITVGTHLHTMTPISGHPELYNTWTNFWESSFVVTWMVIGIIVLMAIRDLATKRHRPRHAARIPRQADDREPTIDVLKHVA